MALMMLRVVSLLVGFFVICEDICENSFVFEEDIHRMRCPSSETTLVFTIHKRRNTKKRETYDIPGGGVGYKLRFRSLRRSPIVLNSDFDANSQSFKINVYVPGPVNSGNFEYLITDVLGNAKCDFLGLGIGFLTTEFHRLVMENALVALEIASGSTGIPCSKLNNLPRLEWQSKVLEPLKGCKSQTQSAIIPVSKSCGDQPVRVVIRVNPPR